MKVGAQQRFAVSLWLFNLFMNGAVKEENSRVLVRGASV